MFGFLLIIAAVLPFQFALNPIAGSDLAVGRVLVVAAFTWWLFEGLLKRQFVLPRTMTGFFLLLFALNVTLSFFAAAEISWFARKLIFLLNFLPLFVLVSVKLDNADRLRKFVKVLLFSGVLSAVFGLLLFAAQFFVDADRVMVFWRKFIAPFFLGQTFAEMVGTYSSAYVNIGGENFLRAVGLFPDPHIFSFYAEILLPLVLAMSFVRVKRQRYLWLAAALILLLSVAATFTRGAYLAVLTTGFLGAVLLLKNSFQPRKLSVFFASTAILIVVLISTPIGSRLLSTFDFTDGSVASRVQIWQQTVEIIREKPLLGTGLGNYSLNFDPLADYRTPYYAHNLYLDIAAETGLISLVLWLLFIGGALFNFWHLRPATPFGYGGFFSLLILSVHGLFDTPIFSVHVLPLIIIVSALSVVPSSIWRKTFPYA